MDIQVNVYRQDDSEDPLQAELVAEHKDTYEDYEQYGFMFEGRWFEIRIPR